MRSLEGAAISCTKGKAVYVGFVDMVLVGTLDGQQEMFANRV